tara:strand:+ start:1746 stop:5156 length:3411 start_codon:yes stop_codon:yes gene_type:complete
MKWQDFYFGWLEKIGYYDWYNATLVEYKTPYPVGGRTNIGSVGFGGDGEPSIQGVPSTPSYTHPAQDLIDSSLENTGTLSEANESLRYGRSDTAWTQFPIRVATYLASPEFSLPQRNTLKYWGYLPLGNTFAAPSNFYRGYSYFSNAMKQKKELRGRRGDVLVRSSKKQWLTDKKNRTYPSLKMNQKIPMLAIKHPDYSHYGDIGNIMELSWGVMSGLSYNLYDAANQEQKDNLVADVERTKQEFIDALAVRRDETAMTQLSSQSYQRSTFDSLSTEEDKAVMQRELSSEEKRIMDEVNTFVAEKYSENKGVMARSKRFKELDYINDRVAYENRNEITSILLGVDANMSVTTAEIILQILANPSYGLNREGGITTGLIQSTIDTEMVRLIPILTQNRLKELLLMSGRNKHPLVTPINLNTKVPESRIGSYYLHFPMNKAMFSTDMGDHDRSRGRVWSFNEQLITVTNNMAKNFSSTNGGEVFFVNQNAMAVAFEILSYWESFEIVDEILMPLVGALLTLFEGEGAMAGVGDLSQYGNIDWLYSLPSWVNPNYAVAIASSETAHAKTFDWLPKDVGFRINGQDQYLYETKLEDWAEHYKEWEPKPDDQRYWDISVMFNQPVTKKSRGSNFADWLETHQIILDLKKDETINYNGNNYNSSSLKSRCPLIENNLGMVSCSANLAMLDGLISNSEYPSMIYEFWDNTVSWPSEVVETEIVNTVARETKGIGNLHSYLTPMDNDTEWWNSFLDENTGILAMSAGRPSLLSNVSPNFTSTAVVFDGWQIGWDFGYMDSIIQAAKIRGRPWAENLTLKDYTEKVYPSEMVSVRFHPKMQAVKGDFSELTVQPDDQRYLYRNYYLSNNPTAEAAGSGAIQWNNPDIRNPINQQSRNRSGNTANYDTFLPIDYALSVNRLKRRNNYGGIIHADNELAELKARAKQPTVGLESPDGYLSYVRNNQGYEVIGELETENKDMMSHSVQMSGLRNGQLQGIIDSQGVFPIMWADTSGFMLMEQENGNLVAIPKYEPTFVSWTNESWEEAVDSTGPYYGSGGLTGNSISLGSKVRGEPYMPTFSSAPKVFFSNLPADSLEVEEMPENLVGRTIDYTMITGNPWRRGKIPIINWCAILSKAILRMVTPPEE